MELENEAKKITLISNLQLIANQVVEGFISGMHKSPFHGFSSEFAEHKIYNQGESTRHIDWKLYAKTDKLFTKKYDEETNLRCHIIIDNSSSMHYPILHEQTVNTYNKLGFSILASASLMSLLKRQRDGVGLSVYADNYEFYAPEKGSERHHQLILKNLEQLLTNPTPNKTTKSYACLHQIAEKIHRRSLIFLFTDLFQTETTNQKLFEALQHLKYNKHEVVLFHVLDIESEFNFNFDNKPRKFVDLETQDVINVFPENMKTTYLQYMKDYKHELKLRCGQYKIKYIPVAIKTAIHKVLQTYLIERQKFI